MIRSIIRDYKKNIDLDYFAIMWIVLSSGAPLYTNFNNGLSTLILAFIAMLYIRKNTLINKKNFSMFMFIMAFYLIATFLNSNSIPMKVTDMITIPIKFISVAIITSKISYKDFRQKYIMVMGLIAVVSLPCFLIYFISPGTTVPGTKHFPEIPMYGTFYYNYGSNPELSDLYRNAGVFLEGGLHAVYEVIAVMFAVSGNSKYKKQEIILFSIVTITTFSSTGLISLVIVLICLIFIRDDASTNKKYITVLLLLLICLAFESTTGLVSNKLVEKGGSYTTRHDDTLVTLKIATERPILGTGAASEVSDLFETSSNITGRFGTGVVSRSNGVANFAIKWGFPMTILYFILMYINGKTIFHCSCFVTFVFTMVLFLNLNSQPIMITPFFYTFFFKWRDDDWKY